MQIVADVLQQPIQLPVGHPGSCLGAAWTAAIGIGATGDWGGVDRFVGRGDLIRPNLNHASLYLDGYSAFRETYRRLNDGERSGTA
jgi:xylulokinase